VAQEIQAVSDEHLAHCAQGGDTAAFEDLVHRFEGRIYRFALQVCGHEADACELTQDTFVSAYSHLGRFDPSRSFTTWLFTIARRKGIDRSRRTRPVFDDKPPERLDTDDPAVLLARREAGEDLWRAARRVLSESQFQTLWLRYAEDLSVREIARVLRKTRPHVKVLLFRARAVLGRELERRARTDGGVPASAPTARPRHSTAPVADLATPVAQRSL
jgi:RNA polymerase sigma-70 factor (ECF subfamily)